ncbi:TlpA disulfide reductase family protein [Flavobacterium sp. MC2016-06]|uniref:TlpA family protein disulfide reductase n=1 Tax=Flavobacterium sp. MC2016-06 TaxID=2676308 RepID=UPI0012BA80F3|nr:TlpA disulfide reductase family protein [Flavobacterium sp. MC2016-06]MBU3860321.1 TlpA family protein disulfide reductase [Flavobacterium sp. MC2016-06]
MNFIKIIPAILFSVLVLSCSEKKRDSGVIKGDMSKLSKDFDKVVVDMWGYEFLGDSIKTSDTIDAKDGKFEYHFKTKEAKLTSFLLLKNNKEFAVLGFVDKNPKSKTVFGDIYIGNENAVINTISEFKVPSADNNSLKYYRVNIEGSKEAERNMRISFGENLTSIEGIKENPDSYVVLYHLFNVKDKYSIKHLKKLSLLFSDDVEKSVSYSLFQKYIAKREELERYGYIHDFNWLDVKGKSYNFEQVRNTRPMALFIFWASWCSPCRAEIPELKQFYSEYKDKVSMVSLSIDNKYADWKMAVEKENMPWLNLSGLPNDVNGVKEKYNINTVPNLILLDQNGKVLINGFNNLSEARKIIDTK